eukprot:9741570-Ditylum_brightwellii.AAC.1
MDQYLTEQLAWDNFQSSADLTKRSFFKGDQTVAESILNLLLTVRSKRRPSYGMEQQPDLLQQSSRFGSHCIKIKQSTKVIQVDARWAKIFALHHMHDGITHFFKVKKFSKRGDIWI